MMNMKEIGAFHYNSDLGLISGSTGSGLTSGIVINWQIDEFTYTFENFFHPFVGQLIQQLNKTSIAGMLDPDFLATLDVPYTSSDYDTRLQPAVFLARSKSLCRTRRSTSVPVGLMPITTGSSSTISQ